MNTQTSFARWAVDELGITQDVVDRLNLPAALEVLVSRIEAASARGAADPLATVCPRGPGGNSRACTRRMLAQLGYNAAQLRVVHRLLAGSTGGWPGLIRLYLADGRVSEAHRHYVRRQVRALLSPPPP